MKALLINGSPRNFGSTSILLEKVRQGLIRSDYETTVYCLGDMNINYCKGCKHCYDTGECIINDDMQIIMETLASADIVVLGTPSYWGAVTGQMKVFFDRSTPYCDTNPSLQYISKMKQGISIVVRTGMDENENISILEKIEHYFGHMGIRPIGRLSATGIDSPSDFESRQDYLKQAFELGRVAVK
ncbi:MAG: flavodoxin family protein [Clostridiales bacterium]|nr:flavodoxin family protein [Clostridiales bacterium]